MIWVVGLILVVVGIALISVAEKNAPGKNAGFPASRKKGKGR